MTWHRSDRQHSERIAGRLNNHSCLFLAHPHPNVLANQITSLTPRPCHPKSTKMPTNTFMPARKTWDDAWPGARSIISRGRVALSGLMIFDTDKTDAAQPKVISELYLSTSLTLPGPALVNNHHSERWIFCANVDMSSCPADRISIEAWEYDWHCR
jgi:hypothetical protein